MASNNTRGRCWYLLQSKMNPDAPVPGPVSNKSGQPYRRVGRPRAGVGGTYSHGPTCGCNPCKARRREPETLAIAAGVGGLSLAPESVPEKPITDKLGHKRAAPRSLRDRVAQYIHYATLNPNETISGLAQKMGIARQHLHQIIKEGQQSGILVFNDPIDRIEYEIIPKVVDNLNYFLDAKDKTVTIEAAKGTIFRTYQDSKGISDGGQTVLALKIETADTSDIKIMSGHIVGSPKELPLIIVEKATDA